MIGPNKVLATAAVLLLLSMTVPSPATAGSNATVDWTSMNSDASHSNYVAQDQVGASDVQDLRLAWTFPFPAASSVPGLNVTGQGSISPPLVVNGTVFLVTNYLTVYALNAETSAVVWSYTPTINATGLPLGPLTGHVHGINYYRGDIWLSAPDCSVDALNAVTGALEMRISDICKGIPGNEGLYAASQVPPVFDGNTMIWTSAVSDGTDAGRGFVAAYDLTNGQLLWRWFVTPPAGGDPSWDVDSCSTNSTSSCHGNVAPYRGDWGAMGSTTVSNGTTQRSLAGAAPSFGDPVVDAQRGIVFVSTSQPSPDWNGTFRPGPDLYADSIIALNATSGRMLWFYQTTPHDLYDFDCGWNMVLGNVSSSGGSQEAVFKACKNGYVYAIGVTSGDLLWSFNPPTVRRALTGNADYVLTGNYSATLPWMNYPSTKQFEQCPGENGAIESDIAYAYSMIFVATMNFCTFGHITAVDSKGAQVWGVTGLSPDYLQANTTIYAIHAATGTVAWSYSLPSIPYRGWLTASNGLVFAGALDGGVHILDATTGRQVYDLYVGPSLYDSPTLGSAADGRVFLYQLTSASSYGAFAAGIPGDLMAFTLFSQAIPSWEPYVAPAAIGVLAAIVVFLILENRSFRKRLGAA